MSLQGEKQMCETLLRGVYKKIFFNPGLADSNRGTVQHNYAPDPDPGSGFKIQVPDPDPA